MAHDFLIKNYSNLNFDVFVNVPYLLYISLINILIYVLHENINVYFIYGPSI
jgi:hypothetical protein